MSNPFCTNKKVYNSKLETTFVFMCFLIIQKLFFFFKAQFSMDFGFYKFNVSELGAIIGPLWNQPISLFGFLLILILDFLQNATLIISKPYVKLQPLSEYGQVRMPDLSCIFICLRRFFRFVNFLSQISHGMVALLCVFICSAKFCRLKQKR